MKTLLMWLNFLKKFALLKAFYDVIIICASHDLWQPIRVGSLDETSTDKQRERCSTFRISSLYRSVELEKCLHVYHLQHFISRYWKVLLNNGKWFWLLLKSKSIAFFENSAQNNSQSVYFREDIYSTNWQFTTDNADSVTMSLYYIYWMFLFE